MQCAGVVRWRTCLVGAGRRADGCGCCCGRIACVERAREVGRMVGRVHVEVMRRRSALEGAIARYCGLMVVFQTIDMK